MMGVALAMLVVVASASEQESALSAHAPGDETRVFIFLAETRPVFVRLRVTSQGRTPEASWLESMRTLWASLDRNGDGVVTIVEADPNFLVAFMRLPLPVSRPLGPVYLDQEPKDGKISIEELAEGLRSILPPIRLDFGRQSIGRTDALFDQLDRNKDEELTRPELAAIAGSLRPLDLDDNEMISALELEPFGVLATRGEVSESTGRSAGATTITPVVELTAGESTYRPARLMLKKFDRGKGGGASRPDGKLSPTEFAIALDAFAAADRNSDDALTVEELRRLIDHPPIDVNLDVTFAADGRGRVKAVLAPVATGDKQALLRQIGDGELEIALGSVRLDIHVENGNASTLEARRILEQQFKAADASKDGYLEGKELDSLNAPQSPLAGLTAIIDRNGDGKMYLAELLAFGDRQIESARGRLVVTTDDQGRAIFGIVDLDRDRRLGARELMRTVDRAMSWDGNGDGRISADEIPSHFQVIIARAGLAGLNVEGAAANLARATGSAGGSSASSKGPDWFQKMDRNHDGDVSRREFLGPREAFDRIDRDDDGLLDADEAKQANAKPGPAATGRR